MQQKNYVADILAATPQGEYYLYTDMAEALRGVSGVAEAQVSVSGCDVVKGGAVPDPEARLAAQEALAALAEGNRESQDYLDLLANAATPVFSEVLLPGGGRADVAVSAAGLADALSVQRLVINAPAGREASAVVSLAAASPLLLQLKVNVAEGASLQLIILQDSDAPATLLTRATIDLMAGSKADVYLVNIDPALARNEVRCGIHAPGAELRMGGLYTVGAGHRVDNETLVEHLSGHSSSEQLFKGIAHEGGVMAFGGLILVKPDAQKTQASQTNRHMLTSVGARAYAKPQLEIYADDVKCSHGATTGQIDSAQLFYMQQRGIDEATARRLLSAAFVGEVVSRIPLADIRSRLTSHLTGEADIEALEAGA